VRIRRLVPTLLVHVEGPLVREQRTFGQLELRNDTSFGRKGAWANSPTNVAIFKLNTGTGVVSLHERASEGQHTLWASTPLLSALCTLNSLQVSFTTSLSRAL
jgi:hypothetical protein